LGTVHDGVTAVEAEWVLQRIQALTGHFIATIRDPTPSLQKHSWAKIAIRVPPIAWAGGRAASAEDTLVIAVQILAILLRLQPLARSRRGRLRLNPGLNRSVLREKLSEVRYQVFYHWHVRERVDLHVTLNIVAMTRASKRISSPDIHRAGAAHALAAGAAESQRRIDFILDLDKYIENHRPTLGHADLVGVEAWSLTIVGIPTINVKATQIPFTRRRPPGLT